MWDRYEGEEDEEAEEFSPFSPDEAEVGERVASGVGAAVLFGIVGSFALLAALVLTDSVTDMATGKPIFEKKMPIFYIGFTSAFLLAIVAGVLGALYPQRLWSFVRGIVDLVR